VTAVSARPTLEKRRVRTVAERPTSRSVGKIE
jgi:hypothetical protein